MKTESIIELTERDFDKVVSDGLTLVDFWAPWCGPCRMQAPVLEEVSAAADVRVAKVNVDAAPGLAARFRVQAIPLLVVMKDGAEVDRLVGMHLKAALLDVIRRQ